jgi:hypothetical protein
VAFVDAAQFAVIDVHATSLPAAAAGAAGVAGETVTAKV